MVNYSGKDVLSTAGKLFMNKRVHVVSKCLVSFDVAGVVNGWKIKNDNLILTLLVDGKKLEISSAQPNIYIDFL